MSIEHIKNILNQRGTILVLDFINQNEEPNFSQIKKGLRGQLSQDPIYASIEILLQKKLIDESYTKHPTERVFSLTEKGKKILKMLCEIETILKEP